MSTQIALDLRLARRKAGYTQDDLAHLLSTQQSAVSALEHGTECPTMEQIMSLSLIYGRSFESYFAEVMENSHARIMQRLGSLPDPGEDTANTFNRPASLERLKRRLAKYEDHGGT